MKAQSPPGLRGIGGANPYPWEALANEFAEHWQLPSDLSAGFTADAALAVLAFNTNQALICQVGLAHVLSRLASAQSRTLAETSSQVLPDGPMRDAMSRGAEMQSDFARSVADAANRWGRSFGHMAFAFPLDYGRQ
jgi:hypothetical protein